MGGESRERSAQEVGRMEKVTCAQCGKPLRSAIECRKAGGMTCYDCCRRCDWHREEISAPRCVWREQERKEKAEAAKAQLAELCARIQERKKEEEMRRYAKMAGIDWKPKEQANLSGEGSFR